MSHLGGGSDAAIHGEHEADTVAGETRDRGVGDAVPFLEAARQVPPDISSQLLQREHGERIAQVATAAGKSPQAYADEIAAVFRETWRRLGITNDDFIRTTEPRHKKVVQEVLQRLHDAGEIYFGEYGGWY